MAASDFATGGGAGGSGGGATGPTILFTAAISGIFFTGADRGKHGASGSIHSMLMLMMLMLMMLMFSFFLVMYDTGYE